MKASIRRNYLNEVSLMSTGVSSPAFLSGDPFRDPSSLDTSGSRALCSRPRAKRATKIHYDKVAVESRNEVQAERFFSARIEAMASEVERNKSDGRPWRGR